MKVRHILGFGLALYIFSCSEPNKTDFESYHMTNLNQISTQEWNRLSQKRIYFGHQSVGFNILDGLNWHLSQNPDIALQVVKSKELEVFKNPVLAHSVNGKNGDPVSKIYEFAESMEQGLGTRIDVAGFKFCYADINRKTNVEKVFLEYKTKMNYLIQKYPNVQFVHFTCPLRTLQQGPKGFINKLVGREYGFNDNKARQKFNELLIQEFKDQVIFDIAAFESTYLDGSRCSNIENDFEVYSMIPEFSYDGGHLTETGKKHLGAKFLIFLAKISNGRNN